MYNAYFNKRQSLCFCNSHNAMFISVKLAYFLISKEKSTWFIYNVISFWLPLYLIQNILFDIKRNNNFCWGLTLLTVSESTNISFSCYTRSESKKWVGTFRFEIRNILFVSFSFNWKFNWVSTKHDFLKEHRLAKELDVTATLITNLEFPLKAFFQRRSNNNFH